MMGRNGYQTVATPYLREVRTERRVSGLDHMGLMCAAVTFVAVKHVDDRSSIRFGFLTCECDGGMCSLRVIVRSSSREKMDVRKWVRRKRRGGTSSPWVM